jgi:hypothetical protein
MFPWWSEANEGATIPEHKGGGKTEVKKAE